MNENKAQTGSKFQRLFCISVLLYPVILFLILVILQFHFISNKSRGISNNCFLLVLVLLLLFSGGSILMTYLIFIPLARKTENPGEKFPINVFILAFGSTVISVYGLILGGLWGVETGIVPLCVVLSFFAFSLIHGYYLYRKYMIPEKIV